MSNNPTDHTPIIIISDNKEDFDLRQVLSKYLYHWPLFLVGLIITMAGASTYLYFAKPVFEIKASLLIQDEKKNSNEKPTLQEIDVSYSSKLVENEMEVLQSRNLILQVVNSLKLWTNYQLPNGYKNKDLYTASPVHFNLVKRIEGLKDRKLEILIHDNKTFLLKDPIKGKIEFSFNREYQNEIGSWNIEPTSNINDFIGETIIISLNNPERVADFYQENLEISLLNEDAPLVSLSIVDQVELRGKDFLNTLIEHYNISTIAEKVKRNQSTLDFIDQRLASLSGELTNSEAQVENFRSSRGLTDISSQSQVYLQNVQNNDIRLNEVNVQLNVIEGIENYMDSSQNEENLPSVIGISDPGLNHLIQQLSQLQLKEAELLATTPENNPVFNPLNRQINSTKSAIKNNITNTKSALLNTKRELESINTKFESSIRKIPGQERQLVSIRRQQAIKEDLYIYLLQKREELSLSYAATLTDARVVDSAYSGPQKEPKKAIILAIAFMAGLAFPAGFIYAKNSMINKVITRKEIEGAIKAPIIMEMSFEKMPNPIVVLNEKTHALSEQFRSLRTQLNILHDQKNSGRVTLLTSSISEEGKSFVGSNLGVALAASGRKTIILELDMRRPMISKIFELSSGHLGLSNYLMQEASIKEVIQPSGIHPNLDIIGSGNLPSNPSELLEGAGMDDLLKFLRTEYEDIILDTPPVQLVTDALIISPLADVTLYLIRQDHTYKSLLSFVENLHQKKQFPKLNLIFNGIKAEKFGYGNKHENSYYTKK